MKNIHILPTDKTSSLYFWDNDSELLFLKEHFVHKTFKIKPQNIYITCDDIAYPYALHFLNQEVLKINGVGGNSGELYHAKGFSYPDQCKKIILTTDQDLIKDGVQPIDDEFLEWFVKNPSCEFVEVTEYLDSGFSYGYKIIIPKEEILANRSNAYEFIDFNKQETLEEVPTKLESVLAKITHQNDLGLSQWYEVVYYADGKWCSYSGSKTFEDGERVVDWKYCKDLI